MTPMKYSPEVPAPSKNEYRQTGGCRYGILNATWPFASLRLSAGTLTISVSALWFSRVFEFIPKDVVAIRNISGFVSWGIQVEHVKPDYPQFIVFWTFNRSKLLRMVQLAGFPAESP